MTDIAKVAAEKFISELEELGHLDFDGGEQNERATIFHDLTQIISDALRQQQQELEEALKESRSQYEDTLQKAELLLVRAIKAERQQQGCGCAGLREVAQKVVDTMPTDWFIETAGRRAKAALVDALEQPCSGQTTASEISEKGVDFATVVKEAAKKILDAVNDGYINAANEARITQFLTSAIAPLQARQSWSVEIAECHEEVNVARLTTPEKVIDFPGAYLPELQEICRLHKGEQT